MVEEKVKTAPSAFCQGEAGAEYEGLTRLGLNSVSLGPQPWCGSEVADR